MFLPFFNPQSMKPTPYISELKYFISRAQGNGATTDDPADTPRD
jgi:hypothetical protein